jgi:hypothetical protein
MAIIHGNLEEHNKLIKEQKNKKYNERMYKHEFLCNIGVKLMKKKSLQYEYKDYKLLGWDDNGKIIRSDKYDINILTVGRCNPILKNPQNIMSIRPDVIGWSMCNSMVIECKTSHADFKNDKKKKAILGSYFWYLTPPGIIKQEELTFEGLIEYNFDTKEINHIKPALPREDNNLINEVSILLTLARGTNNKC